MALQLDTLKVRSLTAVFFVAVMLVGLLWNAWSFIILFLIIHFGCWYEFIKLMRIILTKNKFLLILLSGLLYITMPVLMIIDLGTTVEVNNNSGEPFYLFSSIIPCTIIFSIWINDTMAYIVGSMIGKTQLSSISPKKTWEGTIGGAVLCIVVISAIAYFTKLISVKDALIISAICAFFGTLGDLLESKIKRMANVKDSGSIMPGHGGFLDRFDSFLIATIFVWIYIDFFA
jgi:phosphatidate cytidylyltransferase